MSLAYSPDGALLAVGTSFGAVELYRTSDRTLTGTRWVGFRPVVSVAFSPDGTRLVAVASDEAVRVFGASGEPAPLTTLSLPASEGGPLVRGAIFTGDGAELLVPHGVRGGEFYLGRFRATDGQPGSRQRLGPALAGTSTGIVASPDRKWYATVGASEPARAIVLHRASDDGKAASLSIWSEAAVAFSRDSTLMAAGPDSTGKLKVIRLADATEVAAVPMDLPPRVVALAYSPDGKLLAVSTNQDIALIATDTGSPVRRLPFAGPSKLSFTGDSALLAATGQVHTNVRVFRVADGSVVEGLLATRNMADFSRGTHKLALATESSSAIAILCGLK
jgi:WD40 repeat protein